MKALQHLNKYFWKYKWRFLLGIFFIVLTNIFAVYSPQVINEGVEFLRESDSQVFSTVQEKDRKNPDFNKDDYFDNKTLDIPTSLEYIAKYTGLQVDEAKNINTFDQYLKAISAVAVLLGLLYLVVFLIKGIFLFFTRQTIIVMSRLIEYDLKNEIFDQYQRLNLSFYKRNNTGDLMNRISEDVSKVRMYLGPAIMYTLNLLVMVVLMVSVMITIDVELTLYALAPLPFMSVAVYYVSRTINRKSERVQRQQSRLSTLVQENISGVRVLKAYNREKYSKDYFQAECDDYKEKTLDQVKVDALFMPIIVMLVGLSTVLTIYVGGMKVINGTLEVERIFQFVFYVNMLTWPFASVGWVTSLVQRAEASQERINEFLRTEPEIKNEVQQPEEIKGKIEFRNVSFVYPDSGIKALKEMSFIIKPGETVGIIGRTGSGKSTLSALIGRQFDATEGTVLIDDKPIDQTNLYSLRSSIGYVPQEVFLFSDTIYNNIQFGVDNAGREKVEQAAKDADVHENIMQFPKQYSTLLGERGLNVSGGQKQRISIARAIIKDPKILIFDDCLSAVDTETEEKILGSLRRIMQDKTTLLISHRVSTLKSADKILVMDDGHIVEQGTHESLIEQGGLYAELNEKQLLEQQQEVEN
ncbi:ABC transporter ATP-binding protein [Halocola ammonii]